MLKQVQHDMAMDVLPCYNDSTVNTLRGGCRIKSGMTVWRPATGEIAMDEVRCYDGEEHTALQAISSNTIYPDDQSICTNDGTISTNDQSISTNECTIWANDTSIRTTRHWLRRPSDRMTKDGKTNK